MYHKTHYFQAFSSVVFSIFTELGKHHLSQFSEHFIYTESYNTWSFLSGFFHLASCFKFHLHCSRYQYSFIPFHCMNVLDFSYPFIYWWLFGLFGFWGIIFTQMFV